MLFSVRRTSGARLAAIAMSALLVAVALSFVAILPERPISRDAADNRCASSADGARDSEDPDCHNLLPDGLNIVHEFEERRSMASP